LVSSEKNDHVQMKRFEINHVLHKEKCAAVISVWL